jgi:hypothetical protein
MDIAELSYFLAVIQACIRCPDFSHIMTTGRQTYK